MSFTERQLKGGMYSRPEEYCTCDRCGVVLPTAEARLWAGPDGPQHLCVDLKRCERMKRQINAERRKR